MPCYIAILFLLLFLSGCERYSRQSNAIENANIIAVSNFDAKNNKHERYYLTKNVGLFDRNGNVVIPAEYNSLGTVRNGMIIAFKDAERKYKEDGDCDHDPFVDGRRLLIDTLNNILIEECFA